MNERNGSKRRGRLERGEDGGGVRNAGTREHLSQRDGIEHRLFEIGDRLTGQ